MFRIEQLGLARIDLEPIMGGKSRVSEFLTGRRPLSMTQLVRLRDVLGIPADLLIPKAPRPGRARGRRPARPTVRRTEKEAGQPPRSAGGGSARSAKKAPRRQPA
jgi:HTH-type transcriptional regulator/antitoxin HigA